MLDFKNLGRIIRDAVADLPQNDEALAKYVAGVILEDESGAPARTAFGQKLVERAIAENIRQTVTANFPLKTTEKVTFAVPVPANHNCFRLVHDIVEYLRERGYIDLVVTVEYASYYVIKVVTDREISDLEKEVLLGLRPVGSEMMFKLEKPA